MTEAPRKQQNYLITQQQLMNDMNHQASTTLTLLDFLLSLRYPSFQEKGFFRYWKGVEELILPGGGAMIEVGG